MKLSVIITSHNEGVLLNKAILSVQSALSYLDEQTEIIVNIDRGSDETLKYLESHHIDEFCRVRKTDFGDASEARNSAIDVAEGDYVAFVDGDDLVSSNYFAEALKILEKSKHEIVVHPEFCFTFEDCAEKYTIQPMHDSGDKWTNAAILLGRNRWISAIVGKKSTFKRFPYIKNQNGFGHEDYILNIQLSENGVSHKIAKDTVYFYRRRENSALHTNNATHRTQPYCSLFDISEWSRNDSVLSKSANELSRSFKEKLKQSYKKLRDCKIPNLMITPVANLAKRVTGKTLVGAPTIPQNILWLWEDIAKIEDQLSLTERMRSQVGFYDADASLELGGIYQRLCRQIESMPDYVFFVSNIERVEKVAILRQRLAKLKDMHPDWSIAILIASQSSAEINDLPSGVYIVGLAELMGIDWIEDRYLLLTRLVVQLKCRHLEIIDADFVMDWAYAHRELVGANFDLDVTLPAESIVRKNALYIAKLVRVYETIHKIYVSDKASSIKLVDKYGLTKADIEILAED